MVNFGDLIDCKYESYAQLKSILKKFKKILLNVPGNHDFEVEPEYISDVPEELGLDKMYYSFVKEGWLFVFLDGNDISFFLNNPHMLRQAENMTTKLKKEGKPNQTTIRGMAG